VLKIAGLHHKLWNIDYEQWRAPARHGRWRRRARRRWATAMAWDGSSPARRADVVLLHLESRIFTPLNDPLEGVRLTR